MASTQLEAAAANGGNQGALDQVQSPPGDSLGTPGGTETPPAPTSSDRCAGDQTWWSLLLPWTILALETEILMPRSRGRGHLKQSGVWGGGR